MTDEYTFMMFSDGCFKVPLLALMRMSSISLKILKLVWLIAAVFQVIYLIPQSIVAYNNL